MRIDQILIVIPAYGGFTLSGPQLEAGTYLPSNQHGRDLETFFFGQQLMRSLQADLGR
jgi:hypothetical protein